MEQIKKAIAECDPLRKPVTRPHFETYVFETMRGGLPTVEWTQAPNEAEARDRIGAGPELRAWTRADFADAPQAVRDILKSPT
jgi:hypothetical protein